MAERIALLEEDWSRLQGCKILGDKPMYLCSSKPWPSILSTIQVLQSETCQCHIVLRAGTTWMQLVHCRNFLTRGWLVWLWLFLSFFLFVLSFFLSFFVCLHGCMYVCMYVCAYVCEYACTNARVCVCRYASIFLSFHASFYLSIYLTSCLYIYLSILLYFHGSFWSIHLFVWLSICLYIWLSILLSFHGSIYLFVSLSICFLSFYLLHICLSIETSISN